VLVRRIAASFLGGALIVVASCGGGAATAPSATSPAPPAPGDAGADAAPEAGAHAERPFAGSAGEATQLINEAVDTRNVEMKSCVVEYRKRKNIPRDRVSLSLGIDQEGRLLGVTLPKGKKDEQLAACVQNALNGVAFPRSHAGVITVTKTYEEIVQ
jgi:hypothetical protein